jgi:hypothetical protein
MGVKAHHDNTEKRKRRRSPIEQIVALANSAYNYVPGHRSGVFLLLVGLAVACSGLGLFFFWTSGPAPARAFAGALGFGLAGLWILPLAFERLDL